MDGVKVVSQNNTLYQSKYKHTKKEHKQKKFCPMDEVKVESKKYVLYFVAIVYGSSIIWINSCMACRKGCAINCSNQIYSWSQLRSFFLRQVLLSSQNIWGRLRMKQQQGLGIRPGQAIIYTCRDIILKIEMQMTIVKKVTQLKLRLREIPKFLNMFVRIYCGRPISLRQCIEILGERKYA